jgi:putative endonuclease
MNRGAAAEALAAEFLVARGLIILERNYRCRSGEIDLIVRDRDTLVFVEVRLRSSAAFGGGQHHGKQAPTHCARGETLSR